MRRKNQISSSFLISLFLHLIAIIFLFRELAPTTLPNDLPPIQLFFTTVPKPIIVKKISPPKPIEQKPKPQPKIVKTIQKPKISDPIQFANNGSKISVDGRSFVVLKNRSPIAKNQSPIAKSRSPKADRQKPIAISEVPKISSQIDIPSQNDQLNLKMDRSINSLNESSPDLGPINLRSKRRRGEMLSRSTIGNSSTSSRGSSPPANYIAIMSELAQRQINSTNSIKIDAVFIIDKTGSMADNVRGIRAYIENYVDQFGYADRDLALGLVTFSDLESEKISAHGTTTDLKKFKKRLNKIDLDGGGDLAESGLDAIMTAIDKIDFRRDADRVFVLASDATFHDADYDGRSAFSQDEVIAKLQTEKIRLDVFGLDYLQIKQLAIATGGSWRKIPGRGYLERVPMTLTEKMLSEFASIGGNEIVIWLSRDPRPKWIDVSWKVLNPIGEKCYGEFSQRIELIDDNSENIKFSPTIAIEKFVDLPGVYIVIFRLENDLGHRSILRKEISQ